MSGNINADTGQSDVRVSEPQAQNQKNIFLASDIDVPIVGTTLYVGKAPLPLLTTSFLTPDLGTLRVLFINRGNNLIIWNSPVSSPFTMENGNVAILPGTTANVFITPEDAANDFSGDLDFRFNVELDDWTGLNFLIGQSNTSQNSYTVSITAAGFFRFQGSTTGVTFDVDAISSVVTGFVDGTRHWLRVTRSSGSGDIIFYTSDDGITFEQLGTLQNSVSGSLHNSTTLLAVGGLNLLNTTGVVEGKIYRVLLKSSIDGTTTVDFNPSDYLGIGSTFTSINTDEVWTFNNDVSIVGLDGYLGFDILDNIAIDNTNVATLFDLRASHVSASPLALVINLLERVAYVGWGNIGVIRDAGIVDWDTVLMSQYLNSGLKLVNVISTIFTDTVWISPIPNITAIEISGIVEQHEYRSTVSTLASGTAIFRIDPAIPDAARIQITGTNAGAGNLLFDKRGPLGVPAVSDDFSGAATANITTQSITSVSQGTPRSGGFVARFNHGTIATNGPLAVFQQVEITGYSGDFVSYNGTFIITAIDTVSNNWFEIFSVISVGDDASGSFISNAAVITSAFSTDLLEGLSITVDTTDSSLYDGGTYMYNVSGSTFQINREFVSTQIGSWTSEGLDQKDPRVLATGNADFTDSKKIVCGSVSGNTNASLNPLGAFGVLNLGNFAGSDSTERWKLVNSASGTYEYRGNEPFDGSLSFTIDFTRSGNAATYEFRFTKNTGSGFIALPDQISLEGEVQNNVGISKTVTIPLSAVNGDLIRPEQRCTTDTALEVVVTDFVCYGEG